MFRPQTIAGKYLLCIVGDKVKCTYDKEQAVTFPTEQQAKNAIEIIENKDISQRALSWKAHNLDPEITFPITGNMTFINSDEAFNKAIRAGYLSEYPTSNKFAGRYMYMYSDNEGSDYFKNNNTRKYLKAVYE